MHGRKRIALYGGTFDPVHNGHLEVARRSIQLFEITKLLFVPARQAPHKLERAVAPPLHRYAMLTLATQQEPRQLVSTFELDAADRRYTIDTLKHFRSVLGESAELFFIMGADSWAEITTWRDWQGLVKSANLIVVTRPGYEIKSVASGSPNAPAVLDVRGWDGKQIAEVLAGAAEPMVYVTDIAMVDVSATTIRETVRSGSAELLKALVSAPVADYIEKYRLYKNSNEN